MIGRFLVLLCHRVCRVIRWPQHGHCTSVLAIILAKRFIFRENNQRLIGVPLSVTGRDRAGAVEDAISQVSAKVKLPQDYRADWDGEYKQHTASHAQMSLILPVTLVLIFGLLFLLYSTFKFPFITVAGVLLSAPVGSLLAVWITGTSFSLSSGIGFLALFGVSLLDAPLGMLSLLIISIFLMPALNAAVARPDDRLEV